ncbi:hypothetical protein EUGRSUZ_H01285 [Eucalyptus grandis]|uniref:Uncharacterized protein n=2 Tax=Eucalyptus grandis TaxID=71139 RepID=A0ACC3JP85_EUCGR|nr:hypothetical protein EUGRSUZ_H01285 [Eucalyptus grandis]
MDSLKSLILRLFYLFASVHTIFFFSFLLLGQSLLSSEAHDLPFFFFSCPKLAIEEFHAPKKPFCIQQRG